VSPKKARGWHGKGPHVNIAPVAFRAALGDCLGNYTGSPLRLRPLRLLRRGKIHPPQPSEVASKFRGSSY